MPKEYLGGTHNRAKGGAVTSIMKRVLGSVSGYDGVWPELKTRKAAGSKQKIRVKTLAEK